ncbi:transcriptional regulator, TetR family [Cohaesibacter marisflavi]|uniref:Transcriptional regulator, TetR family n=1 Tax=Cohaesibacter marisflavi TaxID=655353 RepID=A0A1I5B4D1_9HYPH|nr:TetR family transcriptional regulator [Cohaesibacter marisflavi]SFN69470.1 transcriptional regulator, TetR family [Cohaesibacter marisflavi]
MARKTKADKEKTYQALIEAAAELFRSQGFTATTLNEIAERAGVTRGAFYGHFSSKSEVIQAIWEEQALPFFEPIKDTLLNLPQDKPAEAFRQQINSLLELFEDNNIVGRAFFIIMHNMEISDKDKELVEFLSDKYKLYEQVLCCAYKKLGEAGNLKQGVNPDHAAMGFLYILIGMINMALLPFGDFDYERDGYPVFEHYLNSVLMD